MKVTFSAKYSVFAVQAEAGTLVSLTSTPTTAADGVYTVGDSGVVIVNEGTYTDSIYLSTTGSDYTVDRNARIATVAEGVQVWVGSSPLDCPFKKKAKGGGINFKGHFWSTSSVWSGSRIFSFGSSSERLTPYDVATSDQLYEIAWGNDNWEIGVAVKRNTDDAKGVLFGQGHTNWNYKYVPNCELFDTGRLALFVSTNGSDWNAKIEILQFPADTWVFVKCSFVPNTQKITLSYTIDFKNWVTQEVVTAIKNSADPMAYGYFTDSPIHTNYGLLYDLYNCYLKKDEEIIWGSFAKNFPIEQR